MMKKILIFIMPLALLFSCENQGKLGYIVENNTVKFRSWNEGHGFQEKLISTDIENFKTIDGIWAKDRSSVFYKGYELLNLKAEHFTSLDSKFGKDNTKVFCGLSQIEYADADSFTVYNDEFSDSYGKDKVAAYFCSGDLGGYTRIESKSINSFKRLGNYYFSDNEGIRWGGEHFLDLNLDDFRFLGGSYVTDGEKVYYEFYLIEGVDIESFEYLDIGKAKDKNHYYSFEERRSN